MDTGHFAIVLWYAVVLGGGCAALLVIARSRSPKRVSMASGGTARLREHDRTPLLRPGARIVSSMMAHVVPHIVEVAPPTAGSVTRVFVAEQEVVSIGHPLVEVGRGHERWIVHSSIPGVVARCRVRVGDAVERSRPLVSVIRTDDVLVVARFDLSAGPSLRSGKAAWVRIGRATAPPIRATIISAGDTGTRRDDRTVRVVVRLDAAPPDALWPRIAATVDVACDG